MPSIQKVFITYYDSFLSVSDHIIADEECTEHFDQTDSQICEPWLTCGQCSDDGDEAPRVCRDTDDLGGKTSMTNHPS